MIATLNPRMTVADFDQWVLLPDNLPHEFEYIEGEIIKVVSNQYPSLVASLFGHYLWAYLKQNRIKGYVTGADGGYKIGDERYMPDVAYISAARQPKPNHETYNSNAPDLVVEVLSPTDSADLVRIKIANYLAAGTVVWLADPDTTRIEVYAPGQAVQIFRAGDTLTGGNVLAGFAVAVSEFFPQDDDLTDDNPPTPSE
ncbi:MAG: Uma2 family endonuclease [Phototrophicaceae bacterium]|jgi:Uma2 family endonuclease